MTAITKSPTLEEIDLFDSDTNFNAYIAGYKENRRALIRHIASYSTRGDKVVILDINGSYRWLCDDLGGKRIEIDLNNPISLNPFGVIDDEEIPIDLCFALGCACKSLSRLFDDFVLTDESERVIRSYLGEVVKQVYREKGAKAEVTDVKDLMERQDHLYCKIFAEWLNPLPQRRRLRKAVYWKERHRSKRSLYRNRTARLGAQLRSARFYNSVNALSGRVRQPKGNSKTPSDRRYRRSAEVSSQNSSDRLSVRTGLPTFQKDQRLSDSRYSGL